MRNRVSLAALCVALALACPARATVTSTASSASYTCNGTTTAFTIPFPYLAPSHIIATQKDASGAVTTVTGTVKPSIAPSSGTLTLTTACPAGSTLTITRSVPLDQQQSLRTGSYKGPAIESALDKLTMEAQQNAATHATDKAAQTAKDAAQDLALAAGAVGGSATMVLATGTTTPLALADRFANVNSVRDFGAKGDGVTDDTAAIQAAISTGKNVLIPAGAYVLTNSLFANTVSQTISGDGILTMASTLAKPMLCLGAANATCAASSQQMSNIKIRGIQFTCTGTRTVGSAGVSFIFATTTTLDSIKAWGCYAGVDVRGNSIVNTVLNADLRQNNYGFWDKADSSGLINFQGSTVVGGRFEQNVQEGIVLGSNDVRIIGTVVEGNSNIPLGGTGTNPEIRITTGIGSGTGSVDLTDVYMETLAGNTTTSMILMDVGTNKKVTLHGGSFYGNDATNKCIVQTNSTGGQQYYGIFGGNFATFKNYLCGAIATGSAAVVLPTGYDANRDVSATLSATGGATILQYDRLLGLKMTGTIGTNVPSVTTTAASGANAINMTLGSYINLGGTSTIQGNGTGQVILSGNTFLTGGGTATLHAGTVSADGADLNLRSVNNRVSLPTITFTNLGSPAAGSVAYCSDCTIANPCAGGGTGALAKRLGGAWVCN